MDGQSNAGITRVQRIAGYVSNLTLLAGVAIGLYVLADTYLLSGSLETGACPLTANTTWIYAAVSLCAVSLATSFFEPKRKRTH